MRFFKMLGAHFVIVLLTLTGCGGGGGGGSTIAPVSETPASTLPITVSMSTVISGNTATSTVFLAGLPSPDAFGLNLTISMPAGSRIATAMQSGKAQAASSPLVDGQTVILPSDVGFGSGEVMKIYFADVPTDAVPADFGVELSAVLGSNYNRIQ